MARICDGQASLCMTATLVAYCTTNTHAPSRSWNMDASSITAAAVPFVRALRAANVTAPVWLAEGLPFGRNWAVPAEAAAQAASNVALATAFAQLRADGDGNVFYITTEQLYSEESVQDSATAAGLHATDAGFHDMAQAWVSALSPT